MRRYVDVQMSAVIDDGRIHAQPANIHDDDDYARNQGLPGIISDGIITTNWIHGLLLDIYGVAAASGGSLKTKYIAPIFEDQKVFTCARIRAVQPVDAARRRVQLDVWCQDDTGKMLTVGDATIELAL